MPHPKNIVFRAAALLLLAAAASACDSPTSEPPEPQLPALAVGATVQGAVEPGTTNEYRLTMPAGEFRILLRATSGNAADTLVAELVSKDGIVSDRASSAGTDATLEGQSSPWIHPAETVEWLVRVRGHKADDGGGYTLRLFPRSTAPETAPAAIAVNQTVEGESVDVDGDVDEFTIQGTAGEEWLLFAQSTGAAGSRVTAQLVNKASGQLVAAVTAAAPTDALELRSSGRVTVPATGTYLVRVFSPDAAGRGGYRVRVHRLNRAPETASAALALNQAVENEALEVTGDIDEFPFQGTAGQEVILFTQAAAGVVNFQLVEQSTQQVVIEQPTNGPTEALEVRTSYRQKLPRDGGYVLRVSSSEPSHPAAPAAYRFRLDAVNRAPESGPAAVSLGDVVSGAIDRVGDVDEFTFTAAAGQEINLLVQLLEGMSGGMTVELFRGGTVAADPVTVNTVAASLNERGTGRITLPTAGTYTVVVSGPAGGGLPPALMGRYRFELYPVDRRPEAAGEVRLDGPTLTGAIDRPGDVDEFSFAGTAGQLMVIHGSGGAGGALSLQTQVLNPAGEVIAAVGMTGPTMNYGRRVALPTTGTYTLRVAAPFYTLLGMGAYTVGAYTVSPAPEHVSSTLTVGQTVTAEMVDRPGDLDVFTFTGTPGSQAAVFLGYGGSGALVASVRALTEPNAYIFTYGESASPARQSTGRITLENTGYQVVVDPQMLSDANPAQGGAYALRIHAVDPRPEGRAGAYVLGDTVKTEPLSPNVDVDEYTFTVGATQSLRIYWQAPFNDPGNAVWGYLYKDAADLPVWTSADLGGSVRQITLQPGSYRLRVSNTNLNAPSETANFYTPATLSYRFAFIPQ